MFGKYRCLVIDGAAGRGRHAKSGTRLCRTICKLCTWKKYLLKTMMNGEMVLRSHCPAHSSMEQTLKEDEEEVWLLYEAFYYR